jgi:hypothetical protein
MQDEMRANCLLGVKTFVFGIWDSRLAFLRPMWGPVISFPSCIVKFTLLSCQRLKRLSCRGWSEHLNTVIIIEVTQVSSDFAYICVCLLNVSASYMF